MGIRAYPHRHYEQMSGDANAPMGGGLILRPKLRAALCCIVYGYHGGFFFRFRQPRSTKRNVASLLSAAISARIFNANDSLLGKQMWLLLMNGIVAIIH
jgi:hypothetical protein